MSAEVRKVKIAVAHRANEILSYLALDWKARNADFAADASVYDIPAVIMVLCSLARAVDMDNEAIIEGVRAFQRDLDRAVYWADS